MDYLKIITVESDTPLEENSIAINTSIQGHPILEYYKNGGWVPLDNLGTTKRMARLDDLYTHFHKRDWGIGPRFSISGDGSLCLHTELHDSYIPVLSGGIRLSEFINTTEDLDNMNKEIDIYYDYLVSTRDFLEGSSVVDLWEYPTEYGSTLNLVTLPIMKDSLRYQKASLIIKLTVAWVLSGTRKTENIIFTPWTLENSDGGDFEWTEFQRTLGEGEVIVEFHDGCIRVFSGKPEVTECIIHHCSATYDKLL